MSKISSIFLRRCAKIIGKENILTDDISLALYSYDCSLSHTRPDGVFLIKDASWLSPLITLFNQYKIPFVARGSATNHAGGCAPLNGGIILNLTHLNKILEINTKKQYAVVEPGVVLAQLEEQLAPLGFFYAPDPASAAVCTIGGNVAQNASGARCMKYGSTIDQVLEITAVLPTGETLRLSRETSGPDLIGLLTGSEGTLGVITRIKVKILPQPEHIKTFLVTFPSLANSIQAVTDLVAQGITPRCVEALDQTTVRVIEEFAHAGYPIDAAALLLFELDGTQAQTQQQESQLRQVCNRNGALKFISAQTSQERKKLWAGRRAAYAAMARLAPSVLVGDGTVPRSELPIALEKIRSILDAHHLRASLLFHAGDGNFHPQIIFDERNKPDVIRVKQVLKQILQACVDCHGTLSGEHGIGVEKRALMAYQYDQATLKLFAHIKHATDPNNLANPLKILPVLYEEKAKQPSPLLPEYQALSSYFSKRKPFQIVGKNLCLKTTEKSCVSCLSLNRILDIDTNNYTVTAQAGVVVNDLLQALQKHHLFCALPPSDGTLGGTFASACYPGMYSSVIGIEAFLADGSYIRYGGKFVKNAAGYSVTRLFAGSQGKLALITQLTLRTFTSPVTLEKEKPFVRLRGNEWTKRLKKQLDPKGVFK